MIGDFHFLRPWWLLALVPCALLVWAVHRRGKAKSPWRGVVAPHLLPFLLQGESRHSRFTPLHLLTLVWLVTVLTVAGPTWKHEQSSFAGETAALAIVLKVSPSMKTEDVQPSRLDRAGQKIHDLLHVRGNAKTALIAYAGTAHVVMPATTDAGIIDVFVQALDPRIMPSDGDAAAKALGEADRALAEAGGGSILWITDGIAPEEEAALTNWRKTSRTPVRLWPPLLPGDELDTARAGAKPARAGFVQLTADDSDVKAIAAAAKFAPLNSTSPDTRWAESGYWLTPVIAALSLVFFRRGWIAQGRLA